MSFLCRKVFKWCCVWMVFVLYYGFVFVYFLFFVIIGVIGIIVKWSVMGFIGG